MSLLGTEVTYAQNNNTLNDRYNKLYENMTEEERLKKQAEEDALIDTIGGKKKSKPKKPFASYLFPDSLKSEKMFAWKYNPYTNGVERVKVDTLLSGFNQDYFFQAKEGLGSIYLGNLGAATIPLEYSQRPRDFKLSFLDPYKEYLYTPSNVIFYNGKVPFSQFTYITSGQRDRAEEDFRLTHAQNISPSTGFNLTYRNNRTRGMYENQQSINKNFSFAFAHTGKRYTTHFGYVFNSGEMRENGGIKDIAEIRDTLIDLPQNILINLKDAKTRYKGNGFFFTQSLAIPLSKLKSDTDSLLMDGQPPKAMTSLDSLKMMRKKQMEGSELSDRTTLFFGTSVEYDSYKKIYTDTKAESDEYYNNWYIDPASTRDSIRETNLNMRFFAQFQPYNSEGAISLIGGGLGIENNGYYYFKPGDYIAGGNKISKKNFYVYGDAEGKWREYIAWNASVKYFLAGYRSQDLSLGGNLAISAYIKQRPITLLLSASIDTQSPSYWVQDFYSNHFKWNNNFDKEVRTSLDAKLFMKSIRAEIGVNQILSTNTIYYNNAALPAQFSGALSVTSLYLKKDFVVGGFNMNHKILLQTSSNEDVAPVPLAAANIQYFFRFNVVKDVLEMETGFNGSYNTKYYGYGYNPAVSQFYNQREMEVGNYPMLDVFVTGKWKRLRFIIKFQNVNFELLGGRNYLEVAPYPLNRRMLKFGISWSFYN